MATVWKFTKLNRLQLYPAARFADPIKVYWSATVPFATAATILASWSILGDDETSIIGFENF